MMCSPRGRPRMPAPGRCYELAPAASICWYLPGLSTRCGLPYNCNPNVIARMAMAPVEIYTTPYCPYCLDAKALLKKKNVAFTELDVSRDRDLRVKMIERANGRTTVPQIFIGTTHVGGCDDLYELEGQGKLDPLLNRQASALPVRPFASVRPTSSPAPR